MRVVLRYDDLSSDAQTLLMRSILLGGGILMVAAVTIWALLNRFVARPLRVYNATARSIAAGEVTSMPDLGTHEFAELGQTIDDMASALRHQATTDALTGLYNVRDLRTRLPQLLQDAARTNEPFAVLVADLNDLKLINDACGHAAGDAVLCAVGETLRDWAGTSYECWRIGGDEFAVAMPNTTSEKIQAAITRLNALVGRIAQPAEVNEVSLSVGYAAYPQDGATIQDLLIAADGRMYEAKAVSKNQVLAEAGQG
jgi:diguanylate cyclase (GGDEF)-like protein